MSDASTKKREKIIVVLTFLAALYGILDFFILSSTKQKQTNIGALNSDKIIADVVGELTSLATSRKLTNATSILELTATPWPASVFAQRNSLVKQKGKKAIKELSPDTFIYSGVMNMGDIHLAIINGRDYQKDDMIEGFKLLKIAPDHILLGKDNNTFRVSFKSTEKLF